ncbi:glycosyltransferase family 32 protein, partial [Parathielavia appendiculata]
MYSLLKSSPSPWPRSRRRVILAFLAVLAVLIGATGVRYVVWGARFSYQTYPFVSVADDACNDGTHNARAGNPPIPNLVHYVWLLKDAAEFRLSFKIFISFYSAHIFWRPERIYIHTDAAPEVIQRARQSGTPWTRRILAIPGVEFKHVEVPQRTRKGVEIKAMEHKADFLRLAALREYGGVYLDTDAIPLRDIADLRNSGFRNIVGPQLAPAMWLAHILNNGVMMAVPHSNLMTLFYHAAHEFFDGGWETASLGLLTDLGNRLAALPGEVLILQPQAFSPISWHDNDQRRLYQETLDPTTAPSVASLQREQDLLQVAAPVNSNTSSSLSSPSSSWSTSGTCPDVLAWLRYREAVLRSSGQGRDRGEFDLSSSYVLHAFDGVLEQVLGRGRDIDVRYVLERRSNYARAVFPAVWRAVQEGVFPREEV